LIENFVFAPDAGAAKLKGPQGKAKKTGKNCPQKTTKILTGHSAPKDVRVIGEKTDRPKRLT